MANERFTSRPLPPELAPLDAQGFLRREFKAIQRAIAALGFTAGSAGTVTQATNKATGVALNRANGRITMNNANLANLANVSFTLTNAMIGVNDMVVVNHSSAGTAGGYKVSANAIAAGSCQITVRNVSGGALAEAIVLTFGVIEGGT